PAGRPAWAPARWPADCSQRGADRDDDCPAERYGDERAEEAGAEEPSADPGERHELERHHREPEQHRGAVVGDEERQRVQDAAEERAEAADLAAQLIAA